MTTALRDRSIEVRTGSYLSVDKPERILERLSIELSSHAYLPRIDDLQIRDIYKSRHIDLLRAIHPDSEYSAAARAYARAEVYKLEGDQQVKRDWLEEILN